MPSYTDDVEEVLNTTDAQSEFQLHFNNLVTTLDTSVALEMNQVYLDNIVELFNSTATAPLTDVMAVLIERMNLADTGDSRGTLRSDLTGGINLRDSISLAFEALVAENVTLSTAFDIDVEKIVAIVDGLQLAGIVDSRLTASISVSSALMILDLLNADAGPNASSTFDITDPAIQNRLAAIVSQVDSLLLAEEANMQYTAVVVLTENFNLEGSGGAVGTLFESLTESINFDVVIYIGGVPYFGWSTETTNRASARYENFPFNSLARIGEHYLGASDDGLYLLGGADDAGSPIPAFILTGELDFDSPHLKRVTDAFIGCTSEGRLVLKVITTQDGVRKERWYKSTNAAIGNDRDARIELGVGVKSRYWQFQLCNEDGNDLELDRMDLEVIRLSRRVNA